MSKNIYDRNQPQPFSPGDTVMTDFYGRDGNQWTVTRIRPADTHSQTGWLVTARSEKGKMLEADSGWFVSSLDAQRDCALY